MDLNYYIQIKKYLTSDRTPFFLVAKKYIDSQSKILDVGGGDGQFAETIERPDTHMLDGNEESVQLLKQKFTNVTHGKLPFLLYPNEMFDLIHCSHVVEHLTPHELYDFLKEIDRCLKPGGHLIISAPLLYDSFYNDLSHVKPYNPYIFKKYLSIGDQRCATRPLISKNYIIKEELYRYNYKREGTIIFYENLSILFRPIIAFHQVALKLKQLAGIRRVEKTGFTIVLQKPNTKNSK